MLNEWIRSPLCPLNLTAEEIIADPEMALDILAAQVLGYYDEVEGLREELHRCD